MCHFMLFHLLSKFTEQWRTWSVKLWHVLMPLPHINSLRPRPNRRHFADDIFKCIFENEHEWISPRISLKFVPKVRINNIPALVHIMAWRRSGDKPLSEPVMVSLLTHICVTRLQWVKHIFNPLVYYSTHWCIFNTLHISLTLYSTRSTRYSSVLNL